MKTLIIEWQRLLSEDKKTCPRCGATEKEVEMAVACLRENLKPFGVNVRLVKKAIDPEIFKKAVLESNKILIAGKQLEEWLEAKTGQSRCCEVCGDAECRTIEYADQTHESIPSDLIVKAGLLAASQVFHVNLPQSVQKRTAIKLLSKKC
jgi:hypothetical protein